MKGNSMLDIDSHDLYLIGGHIAQPTKALGMDTYFGGPLLY